MTKKKYQQSARSQIITRRTYNRPLEGSISGFETWEDTCARVREHQRWLWERAQGRALYAEQEAELAEFEQLMLNREVVTSGRTLWLGGTDVAKRREASQFNCSFTYAETVYDIVDILWLLLQGCGVGFKPVVGTLTGFTAPIEDIEVIRSTREGKGGVEHNVETWDRNTGIWTIKVGDSAEAWAKSIGKVLAGKFPARKLVLDFSEIRPAGERLKGYGWISSGDESIAKAYVNIAKILNRRAGQLLTKMDILDVVNWLGTVLSSRRSAEICLIDFGDEEWTQFATAKKDYWVPDQHTGETRDHRTQSNNTLLFHDKPTREQLTHVFDLMIAAGGSEPGFCNARAALRRAPWFKGMNPCAEILLGNKSFCNLTETDIAKFRGRPIQELHRALYLAARANYRQTCVDLRDGILQEAWHLNNEFLRLCGVGITGIIRRPDLSAYDYRSLERTATAGAHSMADELGMSRPKNVTTIKPSGTLSKVMDTTEGVHKPLGRFILNNVAFSKNDELVPILRNANYRVRPHPRDSESVLITLPAEYSDVPFDVVEGREMNLESAVAQLDRYKLLLENWCHQNVSNTISWDVDEKEAIIDWLLANWDTYVAVSFLYRTDPRLTEEEATTKLGYDYLPQEVVTKERYDAYVKNLLKVDLSRLNGFEDSVSDTSADCATGSCPIR